MEMIKDAVKEIGFFDVVLFAVLCYVIWKLVILKLFNKPPPAAVVVPELPPLRKRDMTVEELREYDGVQRPDGRICIAVDGKIFDATKAKRLYGKEGPYGIFAGRDASRGLATFSTDAESVRDAYDDLSNLTPNELEGMREWAAQFSEKYPIVGRLLKPGDVPEAYSDDEDKSDAASTSTASTVYAPGVVADRKND